VNADPIPVSVVILAHDERANIDPCLDSLGRFPDTHVLDSGSVDGTVERVRERGVAIHHNPFRGFGTQRNWAIDHIPTKYDWQFHLDADERMTPELADELARTVASAPAVGGYRVPSKLLFCGRWLKRSGQYPAYQVRFFHKQRLRFDDHGHGQRERTELPLGTLKEPMLHHGFSKGVDSWFRKHVGYARREAEQAFQQTADRPSLFSRDSITRRRAVKRLASRLPGRYFLRLLHLLVLRRGIFDGWPGVTYAHMLACYEGMMDVYLRLLRRGVDLNAPA
jgi:glycosyltransferase involved in cell wall biosynthesis